MPLDPQVQQLLTEMAQAQAPSVNQLTPEEARRQMVASSALLGPAEQVKRVEDCAAPSPQGDVPLRVYTPGGEKPSGIVVYFHGGGWVVGCIASHDGYCRSLANAAGAVVVSVEYRLAPEHKYPAAAEDAFVATRWACDNADRLGGPSQRVVVAGDSAGGNLAAVVPLMARDRGGPTIAGQVLIYPITDCRFDTPSYAECGEEYYLTRDSMVWFWDQYLERAEDGQNPYASPMRETNLQGLPPALVMTAGYDPLRDEGEAYARRLAEAGVDVKLSRYDGMIHGFVRRTARLDKARLALEEVGVELRRMLRKKTSPQ